jgi:hypothetical protein
LSSFDGAGIAIQRHFSSGSSLRAGVNLRVVSHSSTSTQDTLIARNDEDSYTVRLALQYLWYPRPDAELAVFMGAGPIFDIGATDVRTIPPDGTVMTNDQSEWGVGATAVFGIEWFVQPSLGIHAEYDLTYAYSSIEGELTRTSGPGSNVEATGWDLGFDTVLFGLSFYF